MKIINLVKSEFKKNFSVKKFISCFLILWAFSFLLLKLTEPRFSLPLYYQTSRHQEQYEKLLSKQDKSFEERYDLVGYESYFSEIKELEKLKISKNSWNEDVVFRIETLQQEMFLISEINKDNKICNNTVDGSYIDAKIQEFCNSYTKEKRISLYKEKEEQILEYQKILKENKYYFYLDYMIKKGEIEPNEFTDYIIENKIEEDNTFLINNYFQYENLRLSGKNLFNKDIYNELRMKLDKEAEEYKAILLYSSVHNIKHDISFSYWNDVHTDSIMTTKRAVNQVYHLLFVVMFLISIMYSGIVSNEYNRGTIKNIISTPVRRWKILASKFIYLVLNSYFLLFLGLIILSVLAGLKYGFADLFTPKLIYSGGKVIEVNYYLYTIKNLMIASIPMICYLSILFSLSTITLNTSITVGVTTVISVLSPILWLLSFFEIFKEIVYTSFWYSDLGFIFNNSYLYIESLMQIFYHWEYGIVLCLIVAIILYVITNIVYIKRDIKN